MSDPLRVLILEDVAYDAELMQHELTKAKINFISKQVDDRDGFQKEINEFSPDIILSDYGLRQFTGLDALKIALEVVPDTPFILVTGSMDEETAAECIKVGAWDYVIKEHLVRLVPAVNEALELKRARDERKKTEEALRASQEYAQNLIDSSLDMIIAVDNRRRITKFNKAAEETLGYKRKEVLGKHVNLLYADPKEGLKVHKKTEINGHHVQEIWNKRKNGEIFPTLLSASILYDSMGERVGIMGLSRDITERVRNRKELEQALEQTKQAEKIKTLFLANMSHEIRTPLSAILGYTELIQREMYNYMVPEVKSFFDVIYNSGKRLMRTVHGILDVSQIEAGTYDFQLELVNLVEIVKNVIRELQPQVEEKGLKLNYTPKITYGTIKADEYCITQAVSNVVGNAIKYTEKGQIDISLEETKNKLILRLKDTGIGMSEEYQDHLFEIFSQESTGYTKKFQGLGLGLALTKRYLDLNDADIEVESKQGTGTIFTMTFKPMKERWVQPRKAVYDELMELPEEKIAKKPHILIVEDDVNSQNLISFFLKKYYDTCVAASVLEAKEKLKGEPVAGVLLDLSLIGNEDGLDLARYMRKTKRWKKLPIIATTAHAFVSDRDNCITAGCNDYLAKPFKQQDLLEKIRQYL